ncbi:MAG TPA: RES family NAD+ phosphorylase [Hyphomicrobiales bacterium]|nr:RES family NAD+ phosphorylase [Hyphomicrobiales bacterium]
MWTPAALSSEARAFAGDLWRVVEAQHRAATMRIVDTLEEQAVLEELIEEAKPPLPPEAEGLHYLLAAPFRYRPYPAGSRFRPPGLTPGVFYASEAVETALAELAFRRLLLLAESPAMAPPARPVEHTAFRVPCRAARALDLTKPPLERDHATWEHVSDYPPCQALAAAAREAGVAALRYRSVRDPAGRANVALLTPAAFAAKAPRAWQTWSVLTRRDGVRAAREFPRRVALAFPLADFAQDARLKPLFGP